MNTLGRVDGFRKSRPGAAPAYYQAEAAGLRWLAQSQTVPVVQVYEQRPDSLVLQRLSSTSPTQQAAAEFGRQLAALHASGTDSYGCLPPGAPESGYIADLDMPYGDYTAFGPMYADLRIKPYLEMAASKSLFERDQQAIFRKLCDRLAAEDPALTGPPESPSRLHGDLWSGNLMWATDGQVWLIDPAAHGGHRETDLAMLALFGAPHLGTILEAYDATNPLAPDWQTRISLHQVWPLLVHSVLFGGSYAAQAVAAANRALNS